MTVEQAIDYRSRCLHYLSNAAAMLRQRESEKASEMLWGALVEALKAVASLKDHRLRTHREIRSYARDVAKELNDERLLDIYSVAEAFHSNFYEGMFDLDQVRHHAREIRQAIERLLALVTHELPDSDEK